MVAFDRYRQAAEFLFTGSPITASSRSMPLTSRNSLTLSGLLVNAVYSYDKARRRLVANDYSRSLGDPEPLIVSEFLGPGARLHHSSKSSGSSRGRGSRGGRGRAVTGSSDRSSQTCNRWNSERTGCSEPCPYGRATSVTAAARATVPTPHTTLNPALLNHQPPTLDLAYLGPQRTLFQASQPSTATLPPRFSARASETTAVAPYTPTEAELSLQASLDPAIFHRGPTTVDTDLFPVHSRSPHPLYVDYLVQGFTEGFSFGYQGPRTAFVLDNLPSASLAPEKIDENIAEESAAHRLSLPLAAPPDPAPSVPDRPGSEKTLHQSPHDLSSLRSTTWRHERQ